MDTRQHQSDRRVIDALSRHTLLFRALGDPARLQILREINRERYSVVELASILGLSRPATSHHLKILLRAGLVIAEKDGVKRYYRPSLGVVLTACSDIAAS